ncbi:LOW QUALITY PROTEIN: adenine phosphoribosyltransferase [Bacillus sp. JCM 19046]|nr:LOW QUALITY PROTEIN: adenine phosphoribosyltransferase [Bacillus sp. JCM 19045]GAF19450.1 LOW QUALITY PROTEIN: adenine phosphoribosyltransferase [Bacillus sp. JCM 19046]
MDYKKYITIVEDWPQEGIRFKDITTLMQDGPAYKKAINELTDYAKTRNADVIVGPEARGFVVGCPIAFDLEIGFVPVRKKGKLLEKLSVTMALNTGRIVQSIKIVLSGQRVVITDDLLATGGTIEATTKLVEELGGEVVGLAFMIELAYIDGRKKLDKYDIFSLMTYQ